MCSYKVTNIMFHAISSFVVGSTVFRLLTDFVCLYTYEFWLSLCKIVRSSVILLLPLFSTSGTGMEAIDSHNSRPIKQ